MGGEDCGCNGVDSKAGHLEKTQDGSHIMFKVIEHAPSTCKEFVVASPTFNFKRWMMWTVVFNAIGFLLDLHLQDSRLMSGVLVLLIILLLCKLHLKVKQESLLVMASLGIQLTTTFASGRTKSIFYDMSSIKDIIINEGITMQRVIFYLALLLRDQGGSSTQVSKLLPLFQYKVPKWGSHNRYEPVHLWLPFLQAFLAFPQLPQTDIPRLTGSDSWGPKLKGTQEDFMTW